MNKFLITIMFAFAFIFNVNAGCMKSEIKQLDAKINDKNLSKEVKAEISKLRDIVAKNEHKDSELAFRSYEKAMSLIN